MVHFSIGSVVIFTFITPSRLHARAFLQSIPGDLSWFSIHYDVCSLRAFLAQPRYNIRWHWLGSFVLITTFRTLWMMACLASSCEMVILIPCFIRASDKTPNNAFPFLLPSSLPSRYRRIPSRCRRNLRHKVYLGGLWNQGKKWVRKKSQKRGP